MRDIKKRISLRDKEIQYWENEYSKDIRKQSPKDKAIINDRHYPRNKYFIKKIAHLINENSRVLEIGCGVCETIKILLDPDRHNYFYIGTDISSTALEISNRKIKTGIFVRCSVEALPFQKNSFDIIFSFGVLHHTTTLSHSLPDLFSRLRDDGILVLHEPVYWDSFFWSEVRRYLRKLVKNKITIAPLEAKLNGRILFSYLRKHGDIFYAKREYSPVRLLLVKLFQKRIPSSFSLLKLIIMIDNLVLKISEIFRIEVINGAGMMLIVKKKNVKQQSDQ